MLVREEKLREKTAVYKGRPASVLLAEFSFKLPLQGLKEKNFLLWILYAVKLYGKRGHKILR